MRVEWLVVLLVSLAINAGALFMLAGYRDQVDSLLLRLQDPPAPPATQGSDQSPWCNAGGAVRAL